MGRHRRTCCIGDAATPRVGARTHSRSRPRRRTEAVATIVSPATTSIPEATSPIASTPRQIYAARTHRPSGAVPVQVCAQPPGDGGPGPAAGFQVAGEALDVGAARLEQAHVVSLAPAGVLAQIQRVSLARQTRIAGQEPARARRSGPVNTGSTETIAADVDVAAMGHLPGWAETRHGWASQGPSDDDSPHRQSAQMITQGNHDNPSRRRVARCASSPALHTNQRRIDCRC